MNEKLTGDPVLPRFPRGPFSPFSLPSLGAEVGHPQFSAAIATPGSPFWP
jgi:hypothetical protein